MKIFKVIKTETTQSEILVKARTKEEAEVIAETVDAKEWGKETELETMFYAIDKPVEEFKNKVIHTKTGFILPQ